MNLHEIGRPATTPITQVVQVKRWDNQYTSSLATAARIPCSAGSGMSIQSADVSAAVRLASIQVRSSLAMMEGHPTTVS